MHPEWVSAVLPDGQYLVIHGETLTLAVWGPNDFLAWGSYNLAEDFQWKQYPEHLDMMVARLRAAARGA
jgi:hypothetical protein